MHRVLDCDRLECMRLVAHYVPDHRAGVFRSHSGGLSSARANPLERREEAAKAPDHVTHLGAVDFQRRLLAGIPVRVAGIGHLRPAGAVG